MADLYVCPLDSKTYPDEDAFVRHNETAHREGPFLLTTPLSMAEPELRKLLIELAEHHVGNSARPCCDGDTTLGDWVDAGLYLPGLGKTWNTAELQRDFTVQGFMAPYVVVVRKADNVKGSLRFDHAPRLYYDFQLDVVGAR